MTTAYELAMAWDAWLRHDSGANDDGLEGCWCMAGECATFNEAERLNAAVIADHKAYVAEAHDIQRRSEAKI